MHHLMRVVAFSLLSMLAGLAIFAPAPAMAQSDPFPSCNLVTSMNSACATQGLAYQAAYAGAQHWQSVGCAGIAPNRLVLGSPQVNASARTVTVPVLWVANNSPSCAVTRSWPGNTECSKQPDQPDWRSPGTNGGPGGLAPVCKDGCVYEYFIGVGSDSAYSPTGGFCKKGEHPEPTDKPDEPDPDDQCKEGDTRPECEKPDDCVTNDPRPECKKDDDDDDDDGGDGDGESSGGGETCAAPPTCSGNPIQCNQLFQQWKIRCQAEKLGGSVTGNPADCSTGFSCKDNPVQCAQLAVARQQLCAGGGGGDGHGTLTGNGTCDQQYVCTGGDPVSCAQLKQAHALRCTLDKLLVEGDGENDMGENNKPSDFIGISTGLDTSHLDANGWLGAGQCPAASNAVLQSMGIGGIDALCNGASVLAAYVLILGWLHASWILGRAASGGNA